MAIFLQVEDSVWLIGEFNFTISFFDTVHCLLEKGEWGSVYPYLMNDLDDGRVVWQDIPKLKDELDDIRMKLSAFPPSAVVWDKDDLTKRPPWGDDISEDITDMSNYYVTSNGQDLFDVFNRAMEYALKFRIDLELVSSYQWLQEPKD